ncbi:unnamed protein product [Closterium sp. NIES-53]
MVAGLVTHLRTSDARYRATATAEFLSTNQHPMFITLYFIVSRLPDSLRSVRDHFLSLDPTSLTVDLLEQHLLAAETSAVAVGAARGNARSPFFEGCSPSPLSSSLASAAAADVSITEDVGAASTSAKRRSSKGKGGRGSGGGSGGGGGGSGSGGGGSVVGAAVEVVEAVGQVAGVGALVVAVEAAEGGGSGGGGTGGGRSGPPRGGPRGGQRQQEQRWSETQSPQQLREWLVQRGPGGESESCPYVIRTGVRAGQTCGRLHTEHICFARLDDAWCAEFCDDVERPRWAELLSAEGDCYRCVPPDPRIAAAALGASASGTPPGTAPAEALHTFTLDSGASRCFFRDSTTLTPLPARVLVKLADPSGGPVIAYFSTVLPCPAHCQVFTSPCSLRTWSGSRLLLVSPATPLWHALLVSCLSSTLVSASPPALACPALPSLRRGAAVRRSSISSFPLTTAPLQTLHMDVWGPARVSGQGRKRYFLLIRTVRLQLRERFGTDLPILRLHSDRGGDFSSDLLRDFCRGVGILQSFTLPDSPQQIAERHIGLVMDFAGTSMIHAAASHFLWPFAVQYAAHQLNFWPRVSLPETSPTLRWTGKVGDALVFRVCGSRAFVRDTSADKLSARAIPCVFLGFVPDAPSWQFYQPTSRRVLPSQDVTFDESVPFYRLFPFRSAPPLPPPLFLAPGPPPVDPLQPQGPAPSGVSQVDPLPCAAPVQVAVDSGAAPGAATGGAASGGAEPGGAGSEGAVSGGAEPGGAEPEGVEPGGAESVGAQSGGAAPQGAAFSEAPGAGGAGDIGAGGAAVTAGAGGSGGAAATAPRGACTCGAGAVGLVGAGDPTEPGAAGAGGAGAGGTEVGGPGAGGAGAAGAGVGGTGAGGAGGARGTVWLRPYFVPLLQQVLSVPSSTGLTPPFLCPLPDQSQPPLQPPSPLPAPSPYTEQSGGLTERREPVSRPISPVRTARRAPRSRPLPVPGTHTMALRPSSVPLRVPLPAPPESSLPEVPDPASDCTLAASPTVACLLATADTHPSFESAGASALVAELLDFAATCRLDYATALVAESVSFSPPSVEGECALGTDVLEDRQEDFECLPAGVTRFASILLAPEGDPDAPDIPTPRSYAEAITGPYSSQWQAAMDAEIASWKSTGTYVDEVPPPGANIVDGMWILRMTTLRVLLHVAVQRDYDLHSLDFSTAFLQGSLHEEI